MQDIRQIKEETLHTFWWWMKWIPIAPKYSNS